MTGRRRRAPGLIRGLIFLALLIWWFVLNEPNPYLFGAMIMSGALLALEF